jgi:putative transposase
MARLPRFAAPGQPQHVIQRGTNRSPLFVTTHDYLLFRECLLSAIRRYECRIHAYVLMTNHVHLLMASDRVGAIGRVMQSVGGRYVRYFNDRYDRSGTLWEGRYRATVIDTEQYLFTCYRYIEENPVRAALVKHPADYRWSSHSANAFGAEDVLVTAHERYVALGSTSSTRQNAYSALFRAALEPSIIANVRDATNCGWALGSAEFQNEISASDRRAARTRHRRKLGV